MPNSHEINKPSYKTHGIACDPLNGVYKVFATETNQVTTAGLYPVIVYGATLAGVCDQLFSAYTLDDDGNLETYTARDTTVSIDYTQEDADQTVADIQEITDGIKVRAIKHPSRDEWAMHVSTHIIQGAREGAKKDALLLKHADKINNGKNKSKRQAKDDGWR